MLRRTLGFTIAVIRTDGGGELWGSTLFRQRLLEETQVIIEPTGSENSAANGKSERGIGQVGVQTQLLLYGSALDVVYWCFAILHATTLLNIRPRHDGRPSPHAMLFHNEPAKNLLAAMRIFGSMIYKTDKRYTRRRPDSATIKGIWLGLHGTPQVCIYENFLTKQLGYAHHYVADELELHHLPGERSPAARFLAGESTLPTDSQKQLHDEIIRLEPDINPWLDDSLQSFHVEGTPTTRNFGFLLHRHEGIGRLQVQQILPGTFVYESLKDHKLIGHFLLEINGVAIRTVADITPIIDDIHDRPDAQAHVRLSGYTFLFGKIDSATTKDKFHSEPHYHAMARCVFSVCMDQTIEHPPNASLQPLAPPLTEDHLIASIHQLSSIDPDFISHVWSILQQEHGPTCPSSFSAALKEPVNRGKWLHGFFTHLSSCYDLGTYGCPQLPPPGATVLPAVVVLKLVLNRLKQEAAHKIRVCVHGGHQIQGRDYEESYAHTILSPSLKIIIAVSCCLTMKVYHFDIHNASQSTPDTGDERGNRTWLKINASWLEFIRTRKPEWWPAIEELLKTHTIDDLAVEMFMFVQGRVDASRKWGELVESVIFDDLGLTPNRADPAVYTGFFNKKPVILGRATDDFLCICHDEATYHAMVAVFEKRWTVHSLHLVKEFFGLTFVHSLDCLTIDQTDKAEAIVTGVYGPTWKNQPASTSYSTPMKSGTAYAESLARADPLDPKGLKQATIEFGFEFRSVLCSCMHLALWTRLDLLTSCVVLAQYQTHTAHVHFAALKHLIGYLRLNPDIPLAFDKTRFHDHISAIDLEVSYTPPTDTLYYSPDGFHIASVDLLPSHHDFSVASLSITDNETIVRVPPNLPAKLRNTLDHIISDPDTSIPGHAATTATSFGPASQAPYTESWVDASLPGGIFEKTPYIGFGICMSGTCVFPLCRKAPTPAENTTEAEMDAGNQNGKAIRWLHLFMQDLGIPFDGPIPVAEDNAATRIIAHTGKLTRNIRHIALKTLSLQALVRERLALFRAVGSAQNKADHFTKCLALPAFRAHCSYLMGLRFVTSQHAAIIGRLKMEAATAKEKV